MRAWVCVCVCVWTRWLCLCLPIKAEDECTLLSSPAPPPLFFHLSHLVHLTHTLLPPCFYYLQYSLHHPVSLSFSSSCSSPLRSWGSPLRSATSSFLSFLCHRLQSGAHPTFAFERKQNRDRERETARLAC